MNLNNCQCIKKDGTQCTLPRSKVAGLNPLYCTRWHQGCTSTPFSLNKKFLI